MAITDYKITDGEITQRNVKSAPDVLSDTPNNNKAVFDNLTEHFIGKYNDLIDNINSDFVDSSEFAEGLTVSDKVRWRYALTKGTSIGLNFSGNITQITTGFRTIVGDIDGLTETDFMDCYLSINGADYECGDSYTSGNSILTSAVINGVTVDIIYDTTNGNITLEHATNPLDTLYWNVSIYRSVAEKVPRKALPADISNDGYTELKNLIAKATTPFIVTEHNVTFEYRSAMRRCRGTFDPPAGYTIESGDRCELYLNGLRISNDQYEWGKSGNKIAILINFGTADDPIPNEDTVYQDVTVVIWKAVK